jgi:CheY-like chemotaxis protein
MFEPFYSTKEVGKGSGMGLAVVHGIVHEYGGHIQAESQAGGGTTLRLWLPAWFPADAKGSDEQPVPNATRAAEATGQGLRGRVLLAEDEDSVREFMQDLLTGWGLGVVTAGDGVEACERLAADPDGFDLLVLDQTMPRMTGLEAAEQLLKLRPTLPVILYTGYSEHVTEAQLSAAGIRYLVKKPLDVPAFRLLLEGLLADRQSEG